MLHFGRPTIADKTRVKYLRLYLYLYFYYTLFVLFILHLYLFHQNRYVSFQVSFVPPPLSTASTLQPAPEKRSAAGTRGCTANYAALFAHRRPATDQLPATGWIIRGISSGAILCAENRPTDGAGGGGPVQRVGNP